MGLLKKRVIVRGGGDIATGAVYRLWKAGCSILVLEIERPLVIRRTVSVAQAVFDGTMQIGEMKAVRINSLAEFDPALGVNVLADKPGESIRAFKPDILVDATMAKKNLGTDSSMAPLVVALGPGFSAPQDAHAIVETKRGHYLGQVITEGRAIPDTREPEAVMGYTMERLLRAPASGAIKHFRNIGDHVEAGEVISEVKGRPVIPQISGVLRGLIHPLVRVREGMKIGDVDPRNDASYCFSISDKALAVGGGVVEAVLSLS